MIYLEYEVSTKQVVQIHENEPILTKNYDYAISNDFTASNNEGDFQTNLFKVGDEFEQTIWINEVDENKNLLSYSAIRNNPNAARLLKENDQLKEDKEILSNYLLEVDYRLVLIEVGL